MMGRAAHRAKSPRQIQDAGPGPDPPDTGDQPAAVDRGPHAIPHRMARLLRLLPDPTRAHEPGKRGSAEDYARIFGGNGRTGPIASKNCAVVACQSSMQQPPPVHRRGSGACPDTRRSNKPCATTISTPSVSPDSMSLPKLNPVEPPWYGPVCPVVGEGWHREVSPYPDPCPEADLCASWPEIRKAVIRAARCQSGATGNCSRCGISK